MNKYVKRNVLTLMTGTGISQVILIAATPIITRLFSAGDIGVFGFYVTVISILVIFYTGRYEIAIMLPKSDSSALDIYKVAIRRSIIFSISFFFIFMLIYESLLMYLEINKEWSLYIIPIGALILAFFNINVQLSIRTFKYFYISKARVVHSLISSLSSVLIALLFKPIALFLVLSDLLGRMLSIMSFHKAFAISDLFNITSKQRSLKERYSKFSTFEQITSFLSIASLQLPIIVIPFIFGTQVGGFYFIIYRVLTAPISLISNAVLDVFKSDASRDFNNTGSTRNIFISTTKKLFLIGLIPFTILVFFAPEIFTLMFGSEWLKAGEYAQILAPSLLLRLVACPIGFILQLREKVELNLFIYGLFFILSSLSLFAAYIYDSVVIMVILISVSTCIFYAVQLYFAFIYSGKIVINSNV